VITDVVVDAASASDQQDVVAVLDRLDETGHKPTELFADAGYASGTNILEAQERGVDLVAPLPRGARRTWTGCNSATLQLLPMAGRSRCITDQIPLTSEVTDDNQVVAIFSHSSCSQCQFLSVCLVKRYQGNYRLKYELPDLATSKRREQQTRLISKSVTKSAPVSRPPSPKQIA